MKKDSKKGERLPKTLSLNTEIVRATNAAIGIGLATDFSDAVEKALLLLLKSEGLPGSLSEDELKKRLKAALKSQPTEL